MAPNAAKSVFKTALPYTTTTWPQPAPQDQTVILDLLCNLLEPLGRHRATHHPPSKGSSKKRKRTTNSASPPPPPPLSQQLLIGLNSTTRHLESLAALSSPTAPSPPSNPTSKPPLTLLILPHPSPSSSLPHAHLPTLVYLSSLATSSPKTKLVLLPSSAETRIATALHLPRVGAIGILEGAPGTESLVSYVKDHVGDVECKWIEEVSRGEWKGVKVVQA